MKEKASNLVALIAITYIYTLLAGGEYASNFGFVIGSGLIGYLLFLPFNKFIMKGSLDKSSKFTKYTISVVLFSVIGIPIQINQQRENSKLNKAKHDLGFSVGRIAVACRFFPVATKKFCSDEKLMPEAVSACSQGFVAFVPPSMQSEFQDAFNKTDIIDDIVKKGLIEMDANYKKAATEASFSNLKFCEYMNKSINEEILKDVAIIKIISNSLKN